MYRYMTLMIGMYHLHTLIIDEETLKGSVGLFRAIQLLGVELDESSCLNQSPPLTHDPSLLQVYNLPSINSFKLLV